MPRGGPASAKRSAVAACECQLCTLTRFASSDSEERLLPLLSLVAGYTQTRRSDMLQATVRHHLTRDDAQLVARLIARDSGTPLAEIEQTLADRGIDAVLDDPRLPTALVRAGQGVCASFPLFAYVMVRHALRRLGEDDRRLADYVAAMLMHFGTRDNAHRISATDDQLYDTLASLVADV